MKQSVDVVLNTLNIYDKVRPKILEITMKLKIN